MLPASGSSRRPFLRNRKQCTAQRSTLRISRGPAASAHPSQIPCAPARQCTCPHFRGCSLNPGAKENNGTAGLCVRSFRSILQSEHTLDGIGATNLEEHVMKNTMLAVVTAVSIGATAAAAQTSNSTSPSSGAGSVKLSQSECTSLWQQANRSGGSGLTQAQASQYVSDFKAANPDGDTTIDQNEWMTACNKGLVKSSSGSGASSGSSGSGASSSGSSGSSR